MYFSDAYLKSTLLMEEKTLGKNNHSCWQAAGNHGDELNEMIKKLEAKKYVYLGRKQK